MAQRLRQVLRYKFHNLMAKGTGAQILLLGVLTAIILLIAAVALHIYGGFPTEGEDGTITIVHESFGRDLWRATMHAMDAGAIGGDPWAWGFLAIMLFVTLGGIFVLSALIGVLNNGLGALIDDLRRGRSAVMEKNHTIILGYTPKVATLLHELGVAGANQKDACVVILADRDKVAMDEELAGEMNGSKLRVVTRSGKPTDPADLELVALDSSKSVIVLAPESGAEEADTIVLKTLLAVSKVAAGKPLHIVAELQDAKTEDVARMVVGPSAAIIVSPPLISRLLVQTGRQSGLSVVYSELLDFGGVEMYIHRQPELAGRTFRDAVFAYDTSTILGVITANDEILLPPRFDRRFEPGDSVIAVSEDDDTVILDGKPLAIPEDAMVAAPRRPERHRERTLVLGASKRLELVLLELDAYVAAGSETVVVGDAEAMAGIQQNLGSQLKQMRVAVRSGDVTERKLLDALGVSTFDHILVLSEIAGRDQEMADARTMITLLHLRDILAKAHKHVPITSEILAVENRNLASVAEADDFIVSNTLVSLMMSQVSENRHLVRIFDNLFSPVGHEIYLKPASEFVRPGADVTYQAVVEAALRRGEVALGLRFAATGRDPAAAFGVVVNPAKSRALRLEAQDKVIVLSED